MARIVPDDWKNMEATGAAVRELDTLAQLAKLPDDYTVYHGVHWTRINEGFSVFGEADFVVVAPSGRVLVIEQKAGFLRETPAGLMKVYMQKERNVAIQLARTLENLHRRFTAAFGAGTYRIEELLYCPDYTVKDASIAGVPEARIVDASRRTKLPSVVLDILPPNEPRFEASARIHHFLSDELALTPDTNALVGQADMLVTRLGRPRHVGAAARIPAVQAARDRYGGLGQDATGGTGDARCGGEGPQRAVRVLQPTTRRPHSTGRAARSAHCQLSPAQRKRDARCRYPAGFQPAECIRYAGGTFRQRRDCGALEVRRVDCGRRPGFPGALGGRTGPFAEAGRRVVVARRSNAELVFP